MEHRRISTASCLFALGMVGVAACVIPGSDSFPDGVPIEGNFGGGSPAGSGGSGGTGATGGAPVCGNGLIEAGENCEDGNEESGDGCAYCLTEACWQCPAGGGACTPAPAGTDCAVGDGVVCDGTGQCLPCLPDGTKCLANCRRCDGASCTGLAQGECASQACVVGVCRIKAGDPCTNSLQCETNLCKDGICTGCTAGADCPSKACSSGVCKPALGHPCDTDAECTTGLCMGVCKGKPGSSCTANHQCSTYLCNTNDMVCAKCVLGAQCADDKCSDGTCGVVPLPSNAYCSSDSDCASGQCTGFPRRCQ